MRLLIFIFIIIIQSGCISNGSDNTSNDVKNPSKVYALIMCDLTSSIDSNLIKDVAQKAYDLLLSLPQGSKVEAYPIDDNTYINPIFSSELPVLESELDLHKDIFKSKIGALGTQFGDAIYLKYKEVNANKSTEHASCIISTLETAYNFFKDKNKKGYKFELVYFSDMIEQCPNSQAGSIYICSKRKTPNKEAIISQIEKNYNPSFDLKSLLDNNISMIITTGIMGDDKCLLSHEQKEVWQVVFSKVGYTKLDFNSFHFRQGLPDKFLPSNSK